VAYIFKKMFVKEQPLYIMRRSLRISANNLCFLYAILFITAFYVQTASAQFLVEVLERTPLGGHRPVVRCDATGANFGEDVMAFSFGISSIGCAVPALPKNACTRTKVPPPVNETVAACDIYFAVVPRGNCSFSEKAYNVQRALPGYEALIVYNDKGQAPIPMSGSKFAEEVKIPVVMVDYACMESILGQHGAEHGFVVTLKASPGYYDLIKYLVPFVAIVGFCFLVLFISLIIRICRERRRLAKKRLSRSNLKKIPVKKFQKGDDYETCAICLEDFVEGEKLRILPCRHAYHCKCIDPWLTKNRKVCPVCKRKVGPSNDSDSSDSDGDHSTPSTSQFTRDHDPLLHNEQPMATASSSEYPYAPLSLPTSTAANDGRRPFFDFGRLRDQANRHSTASVGFPSGSRDMLLGDAESATNRRSPMRLLGRAYGYVKRIGRRDNNPHTLLENEESLSTTQEGPSDVETGGRRTGTNADTARDTSSADGHSMTTVCSNRHIVTVDVEPLPVNLILKNQCAECTAQCNCPTMAADNAEPSPAVEIQPPKRRRHPAAHSRFTEERLDATYLDRETPKAQEEPSTLRPETYQPTVLSNDEKATVSKGARRGSSQKTNKREKSSPPFSSTQNGREQPGSSADDEDSDDGLDPSVQSRPDEHATRGT
jgi:E3 ubiquitin-protein ligase RNF13